MDSLRLDRPVVYFAGGDWTLCPPRGYDLVRVLAAAGNRIVWVDPGPNRPPRPSTRDVARIVGRLGSALRRAPERVEGVEVLSPLLVPLPASAAARRLNGVRLARAIRASLRGGGSGDPIVWMTTPVPVDALASLPHAFLLYDVQDDYPLFPGIDRQMLAHVERQVLERAGGVVAVSETLQRRLAGRHDGEIRVVRNGVDLTRFDPSRPGSRPALPELAGLPRPILGYVGNVYPRMDFELLAAVARARPGWSFVIVGLVRCDVGPAGGLPNVHFLGQRPAGDVPAFLEAFDALCVPHRVDPFTACQDLVKVYEALAMGLPVVATAPDELERLRPHVVLARGAARFGAALEAALDDRAPARRAARQAVARAYDWRLRAGELVAFVRERMSAGR